jgi:hypothetical protein
VTEPIGPPVKPNGGVATQDRSYGPLLPSSCSMHRVLWGSLQNLGDFLASTPTSVELAMPSMYLIDYSGSMCSILK